MVISIPGGAAASAASSGGTAASTARLPPHAIAFEAQMVAQLGRSGLLVIWAQNKEYE